MRCSHLLALVIVSLMRAEAAESPPAQIAVLTGEQVVQILDETVDWYRAVGAQQQGATQPSDLIILNANAPIADKVINGAFELARADAELLSSEVESADGSLSPRAIDEQYKTQRAQLEAQMVEDRQHLSSLKGAGADTAAKRSRLQDELNMINARRNLLDTLGYFNVFSNAKRASIGDLKGRIDAMAVSFPSASSASPAAAPPLASTPASSFANTDGAADHVGIWDLSANALRLSRNIDDIAALDQRTGSLQQTFFVLTQPVAKRLKELSARSDALAAQAGQIDDAAHRDLRVEFDSLAWVVHQNSAILIQLREADLLLQQYRHNLANWREAVKHRYHGALAALSVRVGILLAMLAVMFAASEFWRRLVVKYAQDRQHRKQLLLVRNITTWTLAIAIVGLTPATALSSFATFAGLLTAGIAVAMHSVLLSIVGYFFLLGKYGVRIGDRVQIGSVVGKVIDLGLVRMHLLELSAQEPLGATGRVVTFANSIVFQASGGLLKQIAGVNFAWHETKVTLPPGSDSARLKERLLQAVNEVVGNYQQEIVRQAQQVVGTSDPDLVVDAAPQVQLQFGAAGIEALVRYPVQLHKAAEIDQRVFEALLQVISPASEPSTFAFR